MKELAEAEMEVNKPAISFEIYQQAEEENCSERDTFEECLLPSLLGEINKPIESYGTNVEKGKGVNKTDRDRTVFSVPEYKPNGNQEVFSSILNENVCLFDNIPLPIGTLTGN